MFGSRTPVRVALRAVFVDVRADDGGGERVTLRLRPREVDAFLHAVQTGDAARVGGAISGPEKLDLEAKHPGTDGLPLHSAALFTAACRGHERIVQMLLDAGAEVDSDGGSFTPLSLVVMLRGRPDVIRLLVSRGAKIDRAHPKSRMRAVDYAKKNGDVETVKTLRELGAGRDRWRGALLGLAAGDALGTTLEFSAPDGVVPISDMTGGGPFGLKPGEWTDDTSMALCLAESLAARGFDPRDQMERYRRWMREGLWSSTGRCFDVGNTVRRAVEAFERTGEPFSGSSDPRSAGNGCLMRLAPVALRYADRPEEAIRLAGESARTTHGARECVDACRYFAGLIAAALDGADKTTLLREKYSPVPGGFWSREPLSDRIAEIAAGSFKKKSPPAIKATGYVVDCLEAALWAFYRSDSFKSGALMAVNLGGDADTVGAVYGQLAGAYYGAEAIPAEWRGKLALRGRIEELADGLLSRANAEWARSPRLKPATACASRTSWEIKNPPAKREALDFDATFSDAEAELLMRGRVPDSMDEKWFIYYEDGWLFFHRSWTGECIYWLRLEALPGGFRVVESWSNRDPEAYKGRDAAWDRKMVRFLVDAFLFGRKANPPLLPGMGDRRRC